MTARVNLLPEATRADAGKARQRGLAMAIVLLVIIGLGVATYVQQGTLNQAEDDLAAAEADLAAAQAEVAALAEFTQLEELLTQNDNLLIGAMADEATLAGVLQDIALVTPTEGAFTSIGVALTDEGPNVGTLTGDAEVESSHAPGVERFLLQLERPAGFRNVFPGSSTIDEDDIASFGVTVQLGPEYLTQRYVDGLPEVME